MNVKCAVAEKEHAALWRTGAENLVRKRGYKHNQSVLDERLLE